jgi:hypothetical protein
VGAPLGNQNAARGKRWAAAVERAIGRRATGTPAPTDVSDLILGLNAAADLFVAQLFDTKDLGYFKEFGDRLDGKPKQQIEQTGLDDGPVENRLTVEFVTVPGKA